MWKWELNKIKYQLGWMLGLFCLTIFGFWKHCVNYESHDFLTTFGNNLCSFTLYCILWVMPVLAMGIIVWLRWIQTTTMHWGRKWHLRLLIKWIFRFFFLIHLLFLFFWGLFIIYCEIWEILFSTQIDYVLSAVFIRKYRFTYNPSIVLFFLLALKVYWTVMEVTEDTSVLDPIKYESKRSLAFGRLVFLIGGICNLWIWASDIFPGLNRYFWR